MKKLVLFFILLPCLLYSQSLDNYYFKKNMTIKFNYQNLVDYYTSNLDKIISVNGKTFIGIPIEKEFKKNKITLNVDGYLIQVNGNSNNFSIESVKTKFITFDFLNKKIQKNVNENNDLLDFNRTDDLFDKIRKKLKKIEKKNSSRGEK